MNRQGLVQKESIAQVSTQTVLLITKSTKNALRRCSARQGVHGIRCALLGREEHPMVRLVSLTQTTVNLVLPETTVNTSTLIPLRRRSKRIYALKGISVMKDTTMIKDKISAHQAPNAR